MSLRQLVILGVALLFVVGTYLRARRKRAAALGGLQKGLVIPALQAGDDEGLALEAHTERRQGERRIRLIGKGGGEAVLTLRDPTGDSSNGMAVGKAVLEPVGDRARGAALVAELARWLEQPVPAAGPAGELAPFPMAYVRLGQQDGWEANKLFFEQDEDTAEVFLNLSADGRQARLLEKDPGYRSSLVAALTLILRDGQPPRRTPQNDPLIASMEPLFTDFRPLAGSEKLRSLVAHGSSFLAVREVVRRGTRGCELLRWDHPGQAPSRVAELEGVISELVVAPDGNRAGVSILYPKEKTGLSSNDPSTVAIIDLRTGRTTKLHAGKFAFTFAAAFSPDSARFAFSREKVTRVHDLAADREIASTEPAEDLSPSRWDADGILLYRVTFADKTYVDPTSYFRWRPGHGNPQQVPPPPLQPPGGHHSIEPTEQGVVIRGPGGDRQLTATRPSDRSAFQGLRAVEDPQWLGPSEVVLRLDELMALDLSIGKMRYLFSAPGMRLEAVSNDGRLVVARDGDDRHVWAQRR